MNIANLSKSNLGVKNGKLSPLSKKPNCVSTQTEFSSKRVAPVKFSGEAAEFMAKVASAMASMPGAVIKQQSENYVYVVFTSKIMRFKDDVEVYLDEEEGLMHFRSASRVGYSDLGVNAKRYDAFISKLK